MSEPIAWKNGEQLPFAELSLPVWDLGVVAGASITEMARTYRHKPFRLADHVGRLTLSCEKLGFASPYSNMELLNAARDISAANCQHLAEADDLGIVIFVTAGGNQTYLGVGEVPGPNVVIHTFRLPLELWAAAARDGVRLTIPSIRQIPDSSLPVQSKVRNRLHWWLADRQAAEAESGSRALLLDHEGRITETSTSSFYGVIDGKIIAPQYNVLNSLSRRVVRELAGVNFTFGDLTLDDVPRMTEAFVSSTPVGLFHVRSIDGQQIGSGDEGPVCRNLRSAWTELTGLNPTQQILNLA